VNNARLVSVDEGVGNLHREFHGLARRLRFSRQAIRQQFTNEIFKDEIMQSVIVASVMQDANVGMVQRGDGSGFLFEPPNVLLISCHVGRERFHSDEPVEPAIHSAIDIAHSPSSDQRKKLIPSQPSINQCLCAIIGERASRHLERRFVQIGFSPRLECKERLDFLPQIAVSATGPIKECPTVLRLKRRGIGVKRLNMV